MSYFPANILVRAFTDSAGFLPPDLVAEATRDQTGGHAGASGCLTWFDPRTGIAWAILGTGTFENWWRHWPAIGAAILNAAA